MIELIETTADVCLKVDELHSLRKRIEELTKEEKALKEEIIALGLPEVEGYNCKAVITHVAESYPIDYKAACAFLKVQAQVLNRFTKKKAAYDIVNIRAL